MTGSLCQLAKDWSGGIPSDGTMLEPKIDGFRMMYFSGIDGTPRLWTRQGMPIEGVAHILHRLALMEKEARCNLFMDGEWQVDGSLAETKAWYDRGWKAGGDAGTFYAFDAMAESDWREGGSQQPLYKRKAKLQKLVRQVDEDPALSWEWRPGSRGRDEAGPPAIVVLPDLWVASAGDAIAEARSIWAAGGEGAMIKDALAPYRRNRNASWQKLKPGGPWQRKLCPTRI